MNLMPKTLAKTFAKHPLYSQDGRGFDAIVYAKYFLGSYTFLCTEAIKEGNDWTLFGYATLNGDDWEWGYQSLNELASLHVGPFGFQVERDLYLRPKTTVREALRALGVTAA